MLFWSVTVYAVDARALILNDRKTADRSSRMELRKNDDGSEDIYCGPKAPARSRRTTSDAFATTENIVDFPVKRVW